MIREAALAGLLASIALAAQGEDSWPALGRRASGPSREPWAFVASGYWNVPRGADAFASGIFAADRGALHLEARANYEALHAQSGFIGWTFSHGDGVELEATPIVGVVGGAMHGPIVGLEAAASAGAFDAYIEAEYVRPNDEASYTYAWTELGWRAAPWLRVGAAGQRTRLYGGDRAWQAGPFLQLTEGKLTLSGYWFQPGSSEELAIVSLAVAF